MRRLTLACMAWLCCGHATVAVACQVTSTGVAFGTIDITRASDSTGEIQVACPVAASFSITLLGNGTPGNRFMTGPSGGRLTYELYPDATRTVPWGDGGSGQAVAGSNDGNGSSRFTIYGRVPVQSGVPAGVYGDALSIVVTF